MRRSGGLWAALAASPLVVLIVLPVVALVIRGSTEALGHAVRSAETWEAVGVSLKTSFFSLLAILAFGTPLGVLLGRGRFWGREALRALVSMPAVLPPAAAGIGMLVAFGRRGVAGPLLESVGVTLAFTQAAVVMAQTFVASPFHVLQVSSAFADLDPATEESAMLDGATPAVAFWRVALPQVRGAMFSGGTLAWARALGEFGATILFAGSLAGVTRTMPLAIYLGFETDLDVSIALSCILMVLALVAVGLSRLFFGKMTR
ncbi:MAG: ABC transporter permease subunit [Armatimonadetes bacterium]|nr:ABC transporter permease subunit [Armatimonadota bacterium]